jgi:hypothetical protein
MRNAADVSSTSDFKTMARVLTSNSITVLTIVIQDADVKKLVCVGVFYIDNGQ